MDNSTLTFALSVAGALILLLGSVIWFVVKRFITTLDKRLSSGSETMQRIQIAIERMQQSTLEQSTRLMSCTQFEQYVSAHGKAHQDLEKEVSGIKDIQRDIQDGMNILGSKVDLIPQTISRMLAGVVTIGEGDSDG